MIRKISKRIAIGAIFSIVVISCGNISKSANEAESASTENAVPENPNRSTGSQIEFEQFPPQVPDSEIVGSSKELNAAGFALYQKKEWLAASELFRQATVVDPRNATAWYNLACVVSLAMHDEKISNTYADYAIRCLVHAILWNPEYATKMQHDDDLNYLHGNPHFEDLSNQKYGLPRLATATYKYLDTFEGSRDIVFEIDSQSYYFPLGPGISEEDAVKAGLVVKSDDAIYPFGGNESKYETSYTIGFAEMAGYFGLDLRGDSSEDGGAESHLALLYIRPE